MKKLTKALSVFVAVLIGVIMPLFGSLNASAKTCTPASYACAQTSAKQSEKKTCSKFTNAVKKSAAIIAAPFVSLAMGVGCGVAFSLCMVDTIYREGLRDLFPSDESLWELIKDFLEMQIHNIRRTTETLIL